MRDEYPDNIVNIDGSRGRKPKKAPSLSLRPIHIGFAVFFIVFIYMGVNIYVYLNKEKSPIFEVQKEQLAVDSIFSAVVLRDEKLVNTTHTGYINYYIQNGRKTAKNAPVYSIDSTSKVYNEINSEYAVESLSNDDISDVRQLLNERLDAYDDSSLTFVGPMEEALKELVYTKLNEKAVSEMKTALGNSSSAMYVYYTPQSGTLSYYADNYMGLTIEDVSDKLFSNSKSDAARSENLIVKGLVNEGSPIYRLCTSEDWSIAVKIPEDFYLKHLEEKNVKVYINNSSKLISGESRWFQKDGGYFCEIDLHQYMSKYINDRFVNVEFYSEDSTGLKIPVSALVTKEYYLIPVSCLYDETGYLGKVMNIERYSVETGEAQSMIVYPSRYYSDGFYAYIEKELLNEGDMVIVPETSDRIRVGLTGKIDGVYSVNKGYYQFVRVEKLMQNSEYIIVRSDTERGLRQYDHIALNGSDAKEQELIY